MLGTRNNTVGLIDTYNKLMAYKQVGKARRKAQERAEKGPVVPMASSRRAMVYAAQRDGGPMTPAQKRRYDKKLQVELVGCTRAAGASGGTGLVG